MLWRYAQEFLLVGNAHHRLLGSPFAFHGHASDRICGNEILLDCPVQDAPEHGYVAIERSFLERSVFRLSLCPIFAHAGFRDVAYPHLAKEWKQMLEPVLMKKLLISG